MSNPLKPHDKILNILKLMSHSVTSFSAESEKFEKANVIHSLLGALRNFCISRNYRKIINKSNRSKGC